MTSPADAEPSPRSVACARCGTVFTCRNAGGCWCAAEPYRLPMPTDADEDCLCPRCLRKAAADIAGKKNATPETSTT